MGAAAASLLRPAEGLTSTRIPKRRRRKRPTRSARSATRWSSSSAGTVDSWPVRSTRSTRRPGRSRATSHPLRRARARSAPKCGQGTLVSKTGRFGPFVGCSRYPDCEYIKKDGPPPPDPLPFEVDLPEEPRRTPRPASRATDRERLLGVLELPALRLHHEQRATRRLPRHGRRSARTQGRGGDLPGVRLDERGGSRCHRARRTVPGRSSEPGGAGPACPWTRRRPRGRRQEPGQGTRQGPRWEPRLRCRRRDRRSALHDESSEHDRPSRPPTRERGVGRLGDRPRAGALPPLPRRARRITAYPARLCDRGRRLPRLAGGARHRLAPSGPCRPARLSRGARGGPRALVGRAAAGRDPGVPPLGHPRRPRAGRSVGRHRHAAPATSPPARPRGRAGRSAAGRGGRRSR